MTDIRMLNEEQLSHLLNPSSRHDSPADKVRKSSKTTVFTWLEDVEIGGDVSIPHIRNGWGRLMNMESIRGYVYTYGKSTGRSFITHITLASVDGFPLQVKRIE